MTAGVNRGERSCVRRALSGSRLPLGGVLAGLVLALGQPGTAAAAAPNASFTYAPASPQVGEAVTFTSTSSDFDGDIVMESWDLDGDGAFDDGFGRSVTYTFSSAGNHRVRLRVVDFLGQFGIADERVHVTGGGGSGSSAPPVASFTFSPSAPGVAETVAFTSTSTDPDDDIEAQDWDLDGDGAYDDAKGPTARRAFGSTGPHTVGLRVIDQGGQIATASGTVTVRGTSVASPPAASFTFAPADPVVGQSVAFTSTSTDTDGSVAKVIWDLDNDGQLDDATGPTASWTFSAPGTHTVTMQATDDAGLSAFVSRNLEVRTAATGPGVPSLSAFNLPVTTVTRSRTRPQLLNPFPVIRIRGELVRRGVLVQILSVRSGAGTLVSARCKGAGCPLKTARARVRARHHGLRLHAFERWLPAGVLIEVRVTKAHRIGKLTRFRIRQGRPPARRDLCVGPVSGRPVNCR